jgi:hypothetical protein
MPGTFSNFPRTLFWKRMAASSSPGLPCSVAPSTRTCAIGAALQHAQLVRERDLASFLCRLDLHERLVRVENKRRHIGEVALTSMASDDVVVGADTTPLLDIELR